MDDLETFDIEIKEELGRIERIQAKNLAQALDIAMDRYYSGDYVLDAEDMKDVEFAPFNETKGRSR